MSYIYNLTDTWNSAGTTFTAIKMNVTDTASAAGSRILDFQIGGVTRLHLDKSGTLVAAGQVTANSLSLTQALGISSGGTGATTAAGARVALFPNLTGNQTKVLAVNAGQTDVEWISLPGGGTVTSINASGGSTGLTFSGGPISSSGTLTLGGVLALASGGTGSTTASGARINILPSLTTNAGKVLTVNSAGTDVEWSTSVTGVTGTAPIISSGGTTPAISISAATTSAAGSMSAADKTKLDGIAAGATANTGTVTSVQGTGTVSGLTLTGNITTAGSLTLGGTLSLTSGQVTSALGFTPYNATNPSGYITSSALSGYLPLTGGTLTGALETPDLLVRYNSNATWTSLQAEPWAHPAEVLNMNTDGVAALVFHVVNKYAITFGYDNDGILKSANNTIWHSGNFGSTQVTNALGYTPYNATNPSGYTTNTGTVTSVTAGTGLSGGTFSTSGTIALANTAVTPGSYTNTNITVDAQGRITAASNGSNANTNVSLLQNPVGTTYGDGVASRPPYYFGQSSGDNDGMFMYAESPATNQVRMVFELTDDLEAAFDDQWTFRNKLTYGALTARNEFYISGAGISYSRAESRAPIFRDSDNSAYYVDPDTNSFVSALRARGQIRATGWWDAYSGSVNGLGVEIGQSGGRSFLISYNRDTGSYGPLSIDGTDFQFTGTSGGYAHINTSFRAPIFYDSNDTAYSIDPASASRLNSVYVTTGTVDPSNIGAGVGIGLISESNGFSAAGIAFGGGAGQHGAIVYGSNQMYFGTENGSDNTLASKMILNSSGILSVNTDVRTPIFYDLDDTTYFFNPNAFSQVSSVDANNYLSTPTLYMRGDVNLLNTAQNGYNSVVVRNSGDNWIVYGGSGGVRAPIFYDSDNTVFYIDPNSTSNLNQINLGDSSKFIRGGATGQTILGVGTVNDAYLQVGSSYHSIWNAGNFNPTTKVDKAGDTINGLLSIQSSNDAQLYLNGNGTTWAGISWSDVGGTDYTWYYGGTSTFSIGGTGSADVNKKLHIHGGTTIGSGLSGSSVAVNGLYVQSRVDTPIYYDSDDTSRYVDPNATTSLTNLTVANRISGGINGDAQTLYSHTGFNYNGLQYWQAHDNSTLNPTNNWHYAIRMAHNNADTYYSATFAIDFFSDNFSIRRKQDGVDQQWRRLWHSGDSTVSATGDFRAPIFYDSDNTAFYVDPTYTSQLSGIESRAGVGIRSYVNGSASFAGTLYFAKADNSRAWNWQLDENNNAALWGYDGSSWTKRFTVGQDGNVSIPGTLTVNGSTITSTQNVMDLPSTQTVTGTKYFVSSGNPQTDASPSLQAWTNNLAHGAWMSFHRSNAYAINMGLDSSNVFRIGGWSANANLWQLDMSGNQTTIGSFRAPIFYDSENTGFYVDPLNGTNLNGPFVTSGGPAMTGGWNRSAMLSATYPVLVFNSAGAKYSGIGVDYTSSMGMFFWVNGSSSDISGTGTIALGINNGNFVEAYGPMRAPYFEDRNNTAYFVDPSSRSRMVSMDYGDGGYYLAGGDWGYRHNTPYGWIQFGPANANHAHIYTDRTNFYFNAQLVVLGGSTINSTDIRSSVFYDIDNTAYFADPNSTSVFNTVRANGIQFSSGNTAITLNGATYTQINDPTGRTALFLGGADPANYYDNTIHWFRDRNGNNYGYISANGAYATQFVDYDNTSYYLNPSSSSSLLFLSLVADEGLNVKGIRGQLSAGSDGQGLHLFSNVDIGYPSGWGDGLSNTPNRGLSVYGGGRFSYGGTGFLSADTSVRAPIFYDSDNTAYYVDGAGNSVFNTLWLRNSSGVSLKTAYASNFGYSSSYRTIVLGNDSLTTISMGVDVSGNASGSFNGNGEGREVVFRNGVNFVTPNAANNDYLFPFGMADGYAYSANSLRAPIFYDTNNTGYYVDPHSTSVLLNLNLNGGLTANGSITVGNGSASSDIYMSDSDEGTRRIHCNSNQIGFLNQAGNWGSYCTDDGGWYSDNYVAAPIFYDRNDSNFYVDPNNTSNINGLLVSGGPVYRSDWTTRFQSSSDFVDGTLVTTNIAATSWAGESFIIEITGKSYDGSNPPFKVIAQGYLYNDTIINFSGISYGGNFATSIKVFEDGGVVKFWWPRISYWNSFNVNVMGMDGPNSGTITRNRVTSITNATEPTGTKKQTISLARFMRADAAANNSSSLYAPIFYDSNDSGYYLDANTTGASIRTAGYWIADSTPWGGDINGKIQYHANNWYFSAANAWIFRASGGSEPFVVTQAGFGTFSSDIRVGASQYSSNIYMGDGDEGERRIHCNTNRIGFLTQDGNWGAWSEDSGVWATSVDMRAPIFYDSAETAYYLDPNSTGISLNVRGEINTPGVWISNGDTSGNYNENIRLRSAPNGVSVIGFNAASTAGEPLSSILGFTDRHEVRWGSNWQTRVRNGYAEAAGSYRAPIFYDLDNTAYQVDPTGTTNISYLKVNTSSSGSAARALTIKDSTQAELDFGSYPGGWTSAIQIQNNDNSDFVWISPLDVNNNARFRTGGCGLDFYTDGAVDTGTHSLFVGGGYAQGIGSLRAPLFYDSNETGYFIDPNSTENVALRIRGGTLHGPNPTWGAYLAVGTNGHSSTSYGSVCVTNGNLHIDAVTGYDTYINNYAGTNTYIRNGSNADRLSIFGSANYTLASGSLRAPIFYDSDNGAYYLDPASTSVINAASGMWMVTGVTNAADTINGSTWYGLGKSDFNGAGGNQVIQLAGYTGLRLRTASTYIDLEGPTYPAGWIYTPNAFAIDNQLRAAVYYDIANTGYYVDPLGGSVLGGQVSFAGGSYVATNGDIYARRSSAETGVYYFADGGSKYLYWDGGTYIFGSQGPVSTAVGLYAPVTYDNNNTAFYLDPTATTVLNNLTLGGRNMRTFESNSYIDFMVDGDANTYYPVLIQPSIALFHFGTWSISRGYADTAPWDPIGTGAHRGGLTFTWQWSGDGAWGGNDKSYRVIQFSEQYTTMVGGMTLTVNGMVVWLRGGGAAYRLHGPGGMTNSVSVTLGTYTASNNATYPARSWSQASINAEINNRFPIRQSGTGTDLWDGGTRVLSEDRWINNKYFGSDGAIYGSIFYDTNDGSYYIDPNNLSRVSAIAVESRISIAESRYLYMGGTAITEQSWGSRDWTQGGHRYFNARSFTFNNEGYGNNYSFIVNATGSATSSVDMRAPIFYDTDNTAYSVDAASNSNLYSLTLSGGTYFQPNSWIQFNGSYGLYWPNNNGAHIEANTASSYTPIGLRGSKGGYGGLFDLYSGVSGVMYDSGGNGGIYRENLGRWYQYHNVGNNCTAFGTSTTFSGFNIYTPAGLKSDGRVDSAIFYDSTDNAYYLRPANADSGYIRGNLTFGDYGAGIVGTYSSYRYQLVFGMGSSYKGALDGTNVTGGYGLWWSHPNAGGVASNLTNHGLMCIVNGNFFASLDASTQAITDMRAPIFRDRNNTNYYVDPDATSVLNAVDMVGLLVGRTATTSDVNADGDNGSISVRGSTTAAAMMSFHRVNAYAINMGLGTDNIFRIGGWSAADNSFQMDGSGNLTMLNNITAYSDIRLKKDIVKIDNALDKVSKLNGYTYTRTDTDTRQMGVIAQEVLDIIPEVVLGSEETNYSVAYGNMVALLIEAVKEQQVLINRLEEKVKSLENK